MLIPQQSRSSVAASEQGVVLCRLLATDAHLTRLQRLQGGEGDTQALGAHGRSSRLQVLVPDTEDTSKYHYKKFRQYVKYMLLETTPKHCMIIFRFSSVQVQLYTVNTVTCSTYLAVVFLIQSSHSIPPQKGIWTIYQARQVCQDILTEVKTDTERLWFVLLTLPWSNSFMNCSIESTATM